MATNIFNNQIYSLDDGGNTPGLFFRDNAGGDLGWIIGAHDRGGPNDVWGNSLLIFQGPPDSLLSDAWGDWVTSSGTPGTTASLPANVQVVAMFAQNGRLGINTQNPAYKLTVEGSYYAAGSSIEYKENIQDYNVDIPSINKLRPVTFDYKKEYEEYGKNMASNNELGYIAEEVSQSIPELSILLDGEVRNVDYEKLGVSLISYYQQLESRISRLEEIK